MANNFCESQLEEATLEWFEELGYEVVFGPYIAPDGEYSEREDYSDVILNDRVREALARINPKFSSDAIEDAFKADNNSSKPKPYNE